MGSKFKVKRFSCSRQWVGRFGTEKSHGPYTAPPPPGGPQFPGTTYGHSSPLCWRGGRWSCPTGGRQGEPHDASPEPEAPGSQGRAELAAVESASLSVLGKSFTETGLGFHFKGSYSKDLLIV